MADNRNTLISELDFEAIRSNLAAFIANNSDFTDYNYEGSGLSLLLDVLAFNTHYNSVYLNMAFNENFLDTAQIRSSIVSLAKQLGYTPKSKKSSVAELTFTITETDPAKLTGNTIFIDKNTIFTSQKDNVTYLFSPITTYSATSSGGLYTFSDIKVREGSWITISYTSTGILNEKFYIDNFNIDLDSIEVVVRNSSTDTRSTTYEKISDIKTLTPESAIYYLFESANRRYELSFGDGILGTKLSSGNIVILTYQTSLGEPSNGCSDFNLTTSIDGRFGNSSVVFTNIVPSYGGAEEESIDRVRINAVNNFRTQGRAVTTEDYKFFIERDYPLAQSISVWGGQDNDPPIYGKVFISFKPQNGFVLTNAEKERILNDIIKDKNVVTVIPEIVDPTYTFIQIDSIVRFNSKSTVFKASDIKSIVRNRITEYNNTVLAQFGTQFNYSDFVTYIDDSDNSIIGNITRISLRKNFSVTVGASLQYSIDFQNPLHPGTLRSASPFKAVNDQSLGLSNVDFYIDDDGFGNVRIYRLAGATSEKVIIKPNTGTIDYTTGKVTLNNFFPSTVNSDGTYDLICRPSDYSIGDISSRRNTILLILDSDVIIDVRDQ
jgi:hypothetical protein